MSKDLFVRFEKYVCVNVSETERVGEKKSQNVGESVYERERERERVRLCVREREREKLVRINVHERESAFYPS